MSAAASAAMDGDAFEVRDKVVAFASYEDYLDSQVSELDMFYLEDEDLARQLIGVCGEGTARINARYTCCPTCSVNAAARGFAADLILAVDGRSLQSWDTAARVTYSSGTNSMLGKRQIARST
jgi:hypothetical protein